MREPRSEPSLELSSQRTSLKGSTSLTLRLKLGLSLRDVTGRPGPEPDVNGQTPDGFEHPLLGVRVIS